MAFVIKKRGSKLQMQAGSAFGGMTAAKVDNDTYLQNDGAWTEDKSEARKFGMRVAAENQLPTLPLGPSTVYEIEED